MKATLQQRQQQLMAHLLRGDADIAAYIAPQGNVSTGTRLHIYRNAYQSRLRETLDVDYAVTGSYLGDELFEAMVEGYRDQYLSRSRSLRQYGDKLPLFLARAEPFCHSPQIAELARFERLLLTAFDAAEDDRFASTALQKMPALAWPGMTATFHPSVFLFESDWNAVGLWQALKGGQVPPDPVCSAQAWLVWRNCDLLTEFRYLSEAELCLYKELQGGASFARACEALLSVVDSDQLSGVAAQTLMNWTGQGLISRLEAADAAPQMSSDGAPDAG